MSSFFETGDFADLEMDDGRFWSMTISKGDRTTIKELSAGSCMVHITNASLGVNLKKGTRTVVTVNGFPICVLSEKTQSHALDLHFNSEADTEFFFDLNGQNVSSSVYLTGYVSFDESMRLMPEGIYEQTMNNVENTKETQQTLTKGEEKETEIYDGDDEEEDDDVKMGDEEPTNVEHTKETKASDVTKVSMSELFVCSACLQKLPESAYSKTQRKKGEKRRCKKCIEKGQNSK